MNRDLAPDALPRIRVIAGAEVQHDIGPEARIAKNIVELGIDPLLMTGYSTTAHHLYMRGPDALDQSIHKTVTRYKDISLEGLRGSVMALDACLANPRRMYRNNIWKDKARWRGPAGLATIATFNAQAEMGLCQSPVLTSLLLVNTHNYFMVNPDAVDIQLTKDQLYADGYQALFEPTDNAEAHDVMQLAEIGRLLQDGGFTDHTKETLDARLKNLLQVIQVEAVHKIAAELFLLLQSGNRAKTAALKLWEAHRGSLLKDDYSGKVALMRAVGDIHEYRSKIESNERGRSMLAELADRARRFANEMEEIVYDFQPVYEYLGFEVPASAEQMAIAHAAGAVTVASLKPVSSNVMAERAKADQERAVQQANARSEFDNRLNNFVHENSAFRRNWRLTAEQRRQSPFTALGHPLTTGLRGSQRTGLILPKGVDAKQVIDVLDRLCEYSQSVPGKSEDIGTFLDSAIAQQAELDSAFSGLRSTAADRNYATISIPGVEPLRTILAWLQSERNADRLSKLAQEVMGVNSANTLLGRLKTIMQTVELLDA